MSKIRPAMAGPAAKPIVANSARNPRIEPSRRMPSDSPITNGRRCVSLYQAEDDDKHHDRGEVRGAKQSRDAGGGRDEHRGKHQASADTVGEVSDGKAADSAEYEHRRKQIPPRSWACIRCQ